LRAEAGVPDPEIPEAPTDEGATAKTVRVVKLDEQPASRQPFVIKEIKRIPR
jgi:hypothetical protein